MQISRGCWINEFIYLFTVTDSILQCVFTVYSVVWSLNFSTAACVQIHTSFITVSVTWLFPFRAWTDGKTKDIFNCLYFTMRGIEDLQ